MTLALLLRRAALYGRSHSSRVPPRFSPRQREPRSVGLAQLRLLRDLCSSTCLLGNRSSISSHQGGVSEQGLCFGVSFPSPVYKSSLRLDRASLTKDEAFEKMQPKKAGRMKRCMHLEISRERRKTGAQTFTLRIPPPPQFSPQFSNSPSSRRALSSQACPSRLEGCRFAMFS